MQVYAIRMFNFLRFGEKNNSLVFDLTDEQKKYLSEGSLTMDEIYNDFSSNPWKSIQDIKARGIEKLLGISGIIDGNDRSSNGAGKSSIMEAICYAHYGRIVRLTANTEKTGEAGMSVVTKINRKIPDNVKEFWVEEFFEVSGKVYRIKRGRSVSKTRKTSSPILEFECLYDGTISSESGHRTGDTKKSIEDVNDMPYDLFVSSQMFGQNDAGKFLTGTDKTRKEMLISMLKMETIVSACVKIIREKKSATNKKADAISETIAVLERQAFALYKKYNPVSAFTSYTPSIVQEFSLSINQLLEDLKISIYNSDKELQEISTKINDLSKSDKIALVDSIRKEGLYVKSEVEKQHKLIQEQTTIWQSILLQNAKETTSKEASANSLFAKIKKLQKNISDTNSIIDAFDEKIHNEILEKAKKAKEVRSKYEQLKSSLEKDKYKIIEELSTKKAELVSVNLTLSKYNKQKTIASAEGKMQCFECGSIVDIAHIEEKLRSESSKINDLSISIGNIESKKTEIDLKLSDATGKLQKIMDFIAAEPKSIMAINSNKNNKDLVEGWKKSVIEANMDMQDIKLSLQNLYLQKIECENKIGNIKAQHEGEIKSLNDKLEDLRKRMISAQSDASIVTSEIKSLNAKKIQIESDKNKSSEKIGFITKEIESFKSNVETITEEQRKKSEMVILLKRYEQLEDVFGLDGIQTRIVKKYLPLLNLYVKEFLDILSHGNLNVEMVINDKSEVDLFVHGGSADTYEMSSGGEKMIIRLAVDIGLAILSFARSAKKPEIICLDEIFGPLDDSNTSSVFRMLQHLQDKFSRILLITHKSEIKELIPNNIIVEKTGGLYALSEIKRIESVV